MIGNHKDTNIHPINLLIINYLYNFFCLPYNSFLSIFKQLLSAGNKFRKNTAFMDTKSEKSELME